MPDEVHDILFRPFIEEPVVAVFAFGDVPFVECLRHQHNAHFIAQLNELFCRHIVRCPDCITAHILEHCQLVPYRGGVHCRSERSQVVMQAYSLELAAFSVEEETFARPDFYAADTERCGDAVLKSGAVHDTDPVPSAPVCLDAASGQDLGVCGVESRGFRRPQVRVIHCQLLLERHSLKDRSGIGGGCHRSTFRIPQYCPDCHRCARIKAFHLCLYIDAGIVLPDIRSGDICAPNRYVDCGDTQQPDLAVQPCSRIPS